MRIPHRSIEFSFSDALHNAALLYGIPAGLCIVGIAVLMLPGMTPLAAIAGWIAVYAGVCVPYLKQHWSSRSGSWILFAVSVLTFLGIIINCHYYICVWGNGDVSRPVLMNIDHWSAWNNALVFIGRDDAMPCPWPAAGYGHFVGYMVRIFGADISVPLIFNALCSMATVALTGSIAQQCCGCDMRDSRRIATCAMALAAVCCYFIASGTILIKDTPLAASIALTAWGALQLKKAGARTALFFASMATATLVFALARPHYLLVQISIILAIGIKKDRRTLTAIGIAALCISAVWLYQMFLAPTAPTISINNYIDFDNRSFSDSSDADTQHSLYHRVFHDYYSLKFWQYLALLPVTTAIQFLIPLPWSYDKYLMFGPFISYAHMSFGRYATGGLVLYFILRQLRVPRAPEMLIKLTLTGLFFYMASALQFGGTVSRYGIPLIALLVPCAAFAWQHYRHERLFRVYATVFVTGMAIILFVSYYLTS